MTAPRELVGAVERALRGRRRRRVVGRWAARTMIPAAGVAAVVALLSAMRPSQQVPSQPRAPASEALAVLGGEDSGSALAGPQGAVAAGARFSAPESAPVRIGSSDGTELTLEPGGSLTVVEVGATERFALMRGAVDVHVRKLMAGERFLVDTADAEVEVHGTTFRVAALAEAEPCTPAAMTRVFVTEGVVTVSAAGRELRLHAGEEWPPRCDVAKGAVERRPMASRRVAGSRLEAQNDLFSSAVRAKRGGQVIEALRLFERFIERYPDSSLLEGALVQRMRLLARNDPWAGAAAASRYLARFPDGFARGEARLLESGAGAP